MRQTNYYLMIKTPFTSEQFFSVFEKYNTAIFPLQWILFFTGCFIFLLLHFQNRYKHKLIGSYLSFLWLWAGAVYFINFFSEITKMAFVFGVLFIVQGSLILHQTVYSNMLTFNLSKNLKTFFGYFFIIFGLFVYPSLPYLRPDFDKQLLLIGLPCPTAIVTFGFFLLINLKFPKYLLIIPSIWSVIALSAAINFGVYQDTIIVFAAIITAIYLLRKRKTA